jgi:hypothetical protein
MAGDGQEIRGCSRQAYVVMYFGTSRQGGRVIIEFSIVPIECSDSAYLWHSRFAANDPHMRLRPLEDFKTFAEMEQLWGARNAVEKYYIGQVYCAFESAIWEIGGLLVAHSHRNKRVARTLVYLALGHLLCRESPLTYGHTVVAHVHKDNEGIIPLMKQLCLVKTRTLTKPGSNEEGHEYQLVSRDTLLVLVDWCKRWNAKLKDETDVQIRLGPVNLLGWAAALRDMAEKWST